MAESWGQTIIFSSASFLFLLALFYVAVRLNVVFGLYEPPVITVSRGVYTPKSGILTKLGLSSLESAVIIKDFKAFTRRRELMYVFITPLVIIIFPLMQFLGSLGRPVELTVSPFLFTWMLLTPGAMMAIILGIMIIGEEGSSIWFFFSAPITARSLVKCKYIVVCILSGIATLICSIVGILAARPSFNLTITMVIESTLLIFALGAVSVGAGIRGAKFIEVPRTRMVRPLTSLTNTILCFVLSLVILSPLLLSAVQIMNLPFPLPSLRLGLWVTLLGSALIALIIIVVFYRIDLKKAEEFLLKAET